MKKFNEFSHLPIEEVYDSVITPSFELDSLRSIKASIHSITRSKLRHTRFFTNVLIGEENIT
jgi:hypothetical protein